MTWTQPLAAADVRLFLESGAPPDAVREGEPPDLDLLLASGWELHEDGGLSPPGGGEPQRPDPQGPPA